MDSESLSTARRKNIEYQIEKLEPRIARLNTLSNLWSWIRAGTVIGGFVGGVLVGNLTTASTGLVVFLFGILLFVLAVFVHRRFEQWRQVFTSWRDLRLDQLARINLNWANLPPAQAVAQVTPLAFDLDLVGPRSLHHLLDTTSARPSSQLLSTWLTQTRPDIPAVRARQWLVRELIPLSRFRDRFRLAFRLVLEEQVEGEDLLTWLKIEFPSRRLRWTLVAATILVALNVILFVLYQSSGLPPVWIGSFLLYVAFYFLNQPMLGPIFGALTRLDAELDRFGSVLRYLENYPLYNSPHLVNLCAPLRKRTESPSAHMRTLKIVTAGVGLRSNPILGLILNLILPWDFLVAFLAGIVRGRLAKIFPLWLDICYELDALVALANYAFLNPETVFPEYDSSAQPVLRAVGVGHPLIPRAQRIRNDFVINEFGHIDIITGSNMSGKSTFLKTIGINQCLGYSGAPVCASIYQSAEFRICTCIRITDSIVDGFSYFYAEVKCLKQLLDGLDKPDSLPLLYLIDEIFRGTNNRERLIGSRAYVQSLIGKYGVGLLATHDLELASLADTSPLVRNMHFRDHVENDRLTFDYKIRSGPSPTTNAIKIMRMEGLPVPEDSAPVT